MVTESFPIVACRDQFPALRRQVFGRPVNFLDGPAGSQVPQRVIDAVRDYYLNCNANHGGVFETSRESDRMLDQAHRAVADFVGARDGDEIVFGANMTSLTFALSRAMARTWKSGDEIIVTQLDHDANVTPWTMAALDAEATVQTVQINPSDCTLDLEDFAKKLNPRTRLVAVGVASNAVGTINPIAEIVRHSHAVGAQVFLDAVHFAPHGLMNVTEWDCDFLACSAYKFFGPHVGILWGKRHWLSTLPVYKVRPAANELPSRWMTGTQNHEGIAGTLAAIEYLADLGRRFDPNTASRRIALERAFSTIGHYERSLAVKLLRGLADLPSVRVYGIVDEQRFAERVPTVSFTHARHKPHTVAEHLARLGIFVWHGNYYALSLTEALGLEPDGMVRVGLLHYNTAEEVDRLLTALAELE